MITSINGINLNQIKRIANNGIMDWIKEYDVCKQMQICPSYAIELAIDIDNLIQSAIKKADGITTGRCQLYANQRIGGKYFIVTGHIYLDNGDFELQFEKMSEKEYWEIVKINKEKIN